MIKILLLVGLFSACSLLGFQISNVFSKKNKFYLDLLNFCRNLKNEISFFKTDIISVYSKWTGTSDLKKILTVAKESLENGKQINEQDFYQKIQTLEFLNDNDKILISKMFSEIGNVGYYEQLDRVDYYINSLMTIYDDYKNKSVKMQSLSKKMGILIGMLICIVVF